MVKQPGVSLAKQRALHEEAWALVREGMEVVSRRHASDTLGYNKCRPDEVQYMVHHVTSRVPAGDAAHRARVFDLATSNASCFGVSLAFRLARLCLYRLHSGSFGIRLPPLAAPERICAERFVVQALDCLASTRAVTVSSMGKAGLVAVIQKLLASPVMEASFRAMLETRWTSPDMVSILRMRGSGEKNLTAIVDDWRSKSEAAQRADVAEHGLLVCALPGCDKREVTVREFKVCSACRAVAYCSAEHGGLQWAGGHKHECNDLKAAGAKPARTV